MVNSINLKNEILRPYKLLNIVVDHMVGNLKVENRGAFEGRRNHFTSGHMRGNRSKFKGVKN